MSDVVRYTIHHELIPGFSKAYPSSAGYDLHADVGCEREVVSGGRWRVMTGVSVAMPPGYFAQVLPRSGNALNYGLVPCVGLIDADYRGEIGVILFNMDSRPVTIRPQMRIAQLVFMPNPMVALELVHLQDWKFYDTARGVSGFGSSGS